MTTTVHFRQLSIEKPIMNLEDLKAKTRHAWEEFHKLQTELSGNTIPAQSFEEEIAEYGDLAEETTWRRAYASLSAKSIADGCLEDSQYLIEFYLLYASQKWGWRELLPAVIEQLCMIPEAAEAIERGLAKICKYGCEYGATETDVEQLGELVNGTFAEIKQRRLASEQRAISARN